MIGIYKITNPKNRIYIGQSLNIYRRFQSYSYLSCKGQIRLYNSFKKYGVDNHKFEVITECDKSELNSLERYYQELYNTLKSSGLNCHYTGTEKLKKVHSDDVIAKISKGHQGRTYRKGFKLSDEHKKRIGIANKGNKRPDMVAIILKTHADRNKKGLENPFKGKVHSDETKAKLSKVLKNKNMGFDNSKSITILDVNTGVYYGSIMEVCLLYRITNSVLNRKLHGTRRNNTQFIIA